MKIAISVESTVDLSKELLKQYNIEMIPFTVLLGETAYQDGEITSQDIFDFVAKERFYHVPARLMISNTVNTLMACSLKDMMRLSISH